MHVYMLGLGACAHIFHHEDCSNIVNLDNHGHLYLDTNGKEYLDDELDFHCGLREGHKPGFT